MFSNVPPRIAVLCVSVFLTIFSFRLSAQYIAPQPPHYSIVSTTGATLEQVIDAMYAHANANDTGEGGTLEEISIFKNFWQQRVSANDGSGVNMFSKYYAAQKPSILWLQGIGGDLDDYCGG